MMMANYTPINICKEFTIKNVRFHICITIQNAHAILKTCPTKTSKQKTVFCEISRISVYEDCHLLGCAQIHLPWWTRQQFTLKCQYTSTRSHSVTSHFKLHSTGLRCCKHYMFHTLNQSSLSTTTIY